MRSPDRWLARLVAMVIAMAGMVGLSVPAHADEAPFRYRAPITVQQGAAFVQLPLPASTYARSAQGELKDLRLVDALGERVPFALLAPRATEAQDVELLREAVLYPLPRQSAAGQPLQSPVEVVVQGERVSVRRLGGAMAGDAVAGSPGWLIDLGERRRDDPPPRSLRMAWSGPAEFSAPFDFETSDDLRTWRTRGQGQWMALSGSAGPLTQPNLMLPPAAGRFVRIVWRDAANAPLITGASVVLAQQRQVLVDAPTEWPVAPSPEPVGKTALDAMAPRSLHFDLGGVLPVVQADLQWTTGTRVAPVRVQGRERIDTPWRDLGQGVFYRLERGAEVSVSPPLPLRTTVRYLRVVPDERAAALEPGATRLIVQTQLASLVFATQGRPPYALLAGAADAKAGALPVSTLVPALEDERPRFGRASLGDWTEVPEVASEADAAQRRAALRPWLLWAVLLAGVSGLGFMVWRLLRTRTGD